MSRQPDRRIQFLRPWLRNAALSMGAIASCVTLWPTEAFAFGTISFLGQQAEHQRITRWGLRDAGIEPQTLDLIAGTTWSFGAVGAADKPWRGIVALKAAHCDGGDHLDTPDYPQSATAARAHLAACREWMFSHLQQAVTDAAALADPGPDLSNVKCGFMGERTQPPKCRVLEDLGLALHAAQDFYAHSNWVDAAAGGPLSVRNPPGLGQSGPAPWIDPSQQADFPQGLISGCWDGVPEFFHCGHFFGNARVAHADLNKDEGKIDWSSKRVGRGETARGRVGGNFQKAVQTAVEDTQLKWMFFEGQVLRRYGPEKGRFVLCVLKRDRGGCRRPAS